MVSLACSQCGATFFRTKGRTHEAEKFGWKPYCSRACQATARRHGSMLTCSNSSCQVTFYRIVSQIKKVRRTYCSRKCAAMVNNAIRPIRVNRTKRCGNSACKIFISNTLAYCSRRCFNTCRLTFRPDDLIKKLQTTALKLGRVPSKREFGPAAYVGVRTFGSWNTAVAVAGLLPHRSDSERMYKRRKAKSKDGHQCDSISEVLVDDWLFEQNITHERDIKYPTTKHKVDWRLDDGTFVEYFGLTRDSARYDRSVKEKQRLCMKANITLIEIHPNDLYPKVRLAAKFSMYGR